MKRRISRAASAAVLSAISGVASLSFGQLSTSTYIGPFNGSWNNAAYWNNGIPSNGDLAVIDGGAPANSAVVHVTGYIPFGLIITPGDRLNVTAPHISTSFLSVNGTTTGGLAAITTVNNAGTITVATNNALNPTAGTASLIGGGTILLENGTITCGIGTTGVLRLVNVNNLIRGYGSIGETFSLAPPSFYNQNIVRADVAGQTLNILRFSGAAGVTNTNLMHATNGATLGIAGTPVGGDFFNTGGTIRADNGSFVHIRDNARIYGGTLSTTGTGQVIIASTTTFGPQINGVTIAGNIVTPDGGAWYAIGTITNNGSINLVGGAGTSEMYMAGLTSIEGGTINMNGDGAGIRLAGFAFRNVSYTRGRGTIGFPGAPGQQIINHGTIVADIPGAELLVGGGTFSSTNTGLIRATNGGFLTFDGTNGGNWFSSAGTFQADNNSGITLINGQSLGGGTLFTSGTGVMSVGASETATLQNFTNSGGNIFVSKSATLNVQGNLNNSGTYAIGGTGLNSAAMSAVGSATTTFSGGGTVLLDGPNAIFTGGVNSRLVNTNNRILGHGSLGTNILAITNNGTITAVGGTLFIDAPNTGSTAFVSNGTLSAVSGATLTLSGNGGGTFASTAGRISIATGGVLSTTNTATVNAGTLLLDGTTFQAGAATFGQVSGNGALVTQGTGHTRAAHVRGPTVTVNAGGTLTILAGSGTVGTSRIGAVPSLPGRWDLTDNDLIVDYTMGNPQTLIRSLLTTGYAGGSWNGTGLMSSTPTGSAPITALGYAASADLFTAFPQIFSGQVIDSTTVVVSHVLAGDTNLDRTVNITDFSIVAANFNLTTNKWVLGDFNYDGITNIADFSLVAANFNITLLSDLPRTDIPEAGAFSAIACMALFRRARLIGRERKATS